jgi:predicted permease
MTPPRGALIRVLLGIIDAGRWLVPASRRREWRRQWRADIWHEWIWIRNHPHGLAEPATLAARTLGALRHAFHLRIHMRDLEVITHDLRYGWRMMVRKPGFTALAVLTLGLGIGANVTIYSWVESMVRRPLHGVADPDRLVVLNGTTRTRATLSISYPDFVDFRQRKPDSVEDLIAFTMLPMNLRTTGDPIRVFGQLVTGNYFDVLGARIALGRGFRPEEDRTPNSHPVVVFSHNFWQRQFAGDPSIVGGTVILNGRAFTVIGVAPAGFRGSVAFLNLDAWVPMMMQSTMTGGGDRLGVRGNSWLQALVKLKPGIGIGRAQADMDALAKDLAATYPDDAGRGVRLYELWRAPNSGGSTAAMVMGVQMIVVGIVLLIACANVANLLLSRAASRQRETAVRLALGASRRRLVQQMLTESTMLAVAGGIAGVVLAYSTTDLIQWLVPPVTLPIELDSSIGVPVLLFAVGVTGLSVLFFGLVPALQGSSSAVMTGLKEANGAMGASRRRTRLRSVLVVAQVAMSLMLLVSAGLFVRTLRNAQSIDPGFSTRSGVTASIDLLPAGYDDARGRVFLRNLVARVRELPGVDAATLAQRMPLGFDGTSDFGVKVDGYTPAANEEMSVYYNRVGSDYLRTMGIGVVEGRDFSDRDTAESTDVTIVNETLVRRYFAGRTAIGGRIKVGQRTLQIVGIARDGKYANITEPPRPFMYLPVDQWYRPATVLTVKTAGDPTAIIPALHQVVRSLDANVPLFDIRTVAEHLEVAVFVQRMIASLLGMFGGLALLLATVGLYGVVAGIVAQRTPEIGMRMALGASRRDVVTLILKQGFAMTGIGIAIGLAGALVVARLFKGLLLNVSATDGVSFAGTTVLLALVALASTYFPARRAASIDPLIALRNE